MLQFQLTLGQNPQLPWEHVDLKDKTLLIPDPKNHEPLTLPLSDFLLRILNERKDLAIEVVLVYWTVLRQS